MIMQDDRTEGQRTYHLAVGGTDRFLSGWGLAGGGPSFAFWAYPDGEGAAAETWVRLRGDIGRVRTISLDKYRPRGLGHCHVYVYGKREL